MYENYYKAFCRDTEIAARILHYRLHLDKRAAESEVYQKLNETARFWIDFKKLCDDFVIIRLGMIFDPETEKTYNAFKLLGELARNLPHFNKANLRTRKVQLSGSEFEGLNKYIENAHELTKEDVQSIKSKLRAAKAIWKEFEPIRNRVCAHHEIIADEERNKIFSEATYNKLKQLVQILLNISEEIWQAEHNGKKPDFTDDHRRSINEAEEEIDNLVALLVKS